MRRINWGFVALALVLKNQILINRYLNKFIKRIYAGPQIFKYKTKRAISNNYSLLNRYTLCCKEILFYNLKQKEICV